jgi:hypothetical protein
MPLSNVDIAAPTLGCGNAIVTIGYRRAGRNPIGLVRTVIGVTIADIVSILDQPRSVENARRDGRSGLTAIGPQTER